MEGIFCTVKHDPVESVIFASIEGVGIAILLIIDPRNHCFSQESSFKNRGVGILTLQGGVCRNLPFIHVGVVGVLL